MKLKLSGYNTAKIEYLINSRPLAPLHDTLDDINALSPNNFLLNKRENLPVLNNYNYKDPEDANLMKIWKTRQLNPASRLTHSTFNVT